MMVELLDSYLLQIIYNLLLQSKETIIAFIMFQISFGIVHVHLLETMDLIQPILNWDSE